MPANTAIIRAITEVVLPMLTRVASEEFALKLPYTSIVKIVLMLFVMDANEDTIAATKLQS